MFYLKGGLIVVLGLGVIGSFGSVDLGLITIGQALQQAAVCVVLIALAAYLEEVIGIAYYLLRGLYKAAQRLPQHLRRLHTANRRPTESPRSHAGR